MIKVKRKVGGGESGKREEMGLKRVKSDVGIIYRYITY